MKSIIVLVVIMWVVGVYAMLCVLCNKLCEMERTLNDIKHDQGILGMKIDSGVESNYAIGIKTLDTVSKMYVERELKKLKKAEKEKK